MRLINSRMLLIFFLIEGRLGVCRGYRRVFTALRDRLIQPTKRHHGPIVRRTSAVPQHQKMYVGAKRRDNNNEKFFK
jgi:hypothetical protein